MYDIGILIPNETTDTIFCWFRPSNRIALKYGKASNGCGHGMEPSRVAAR